MKLLINLATTALGPFAKRRDSSMLLLTQEMAQLELFLTHLEVYQDL